MFLRSPAKTPIHSDRCQAGMNITLDKGHLGGQNGVLGMIRDFCTSICGVMHSTRDTNTETTREIEYTRDDFFKSCVTFFMLYIIKTGRIISANWNTEINGQDRVIIKSSAITVCAEKNVRPVCII